MTYQELIEKTSLKTILTNEVKIYKDLNISILNDKWVNAVASKLSVITSVLNDYELLYSEEASLNILTNIISRNFFNLVNNFVNYTNFISDTWTDLNNYNDTQETTANTSEGYAGYSVNNQDGDFLKTRGTTTSTIHDKLKYMSFFNQTLEEWGNFITSIIKKEMLVLVY